MATNRSFLKRRFMNSPWHLPVIFLVCLFGAQAQPQESKGTQKSQEEVTKLRAQLINIDVMVKDKKGKYITDFKAEDFIVFEDGVQQQIEFFDPPLAAANETSRPATTPQVESQAQGGKPMNIITLVLDGQSTEVGNLKQVREGTLKYIRERITDSDTVSLFAVTNVLQLLQTFTQDKAKLISAVENAYSISASAKNLEHRDINEEIRRQREELRSVEGATDPASQLRAMLATRALDRFVKLRSQLSLQQGRPLLAALASICEAQRAVPGKKTLVLFSQGVVTAASLDWQVQATIDIANRANVAIYVMDSAGLRAGAPQSSGPVPTAALQGVSAMNKTEDRIRTVGGENVFDHVRHEGLNREQDVLYRISGDTGGDFIKGTNDISKGLDRIDQETRSRYTLAYYSTNQSFDGNYRKLKVEVRRPDARVLSRAGYFAIEGETIVPLSAEDKRLLANFASAESAPALPLFVDLSRFRSFEGRYIVPLSIELPPGAVKFERKGDKQRMHIDVLGVVRETEDKILSRLGGSFDVGLAPAQYQSILSNNIFYRQDVELAPGSYSVDLIIRDRLSGKMAARKEKLVLPVADAEFSTSGVVLSRLALPANNPPGAAGSGDVLSQAGVQIRPSPSREFRSADNLIIFFELYNAAKMAETGKPLVRVSVMVMKDGKLAVKPIDYMLTETLTDPVPHLLFAKYISLAGLSPGRYSAKIEATDAVAHKQTTQEASFVIKE